MLGGVPYIDDPGVGGPTRSCFYGIFERFMQTSLAVVFVDSGPGAPDDDPCRVYTDVVGVVLRPIGSDYAVDAHGSAAEGSLCCEHAVAMPEMCFWCRSSVLRCCVSISCLHCDPLEIFAVASLAWSRSAPWALHRVLPRFHENDPVSPRRLAYGAGVLGRPHPPMFALSSWPWHRSL